MQNGFLNCFINKKTQILNVVISPARRRSYLPAHQLKTSVFNWCGGPISI